MVRTQIDPTRSAAAEKAWETRRKLHPEKYGQKGEGKSRERVKRQKRATVPRRVEESEAPKPKWHLTSTSKLTVAVSYPKRTLKLNRFIDKPWVEKFRPNSLNEMVGTVVGLLKAYVQTGSIPQALIFHGEYGDGKTTAARCMVRDFYVLRGLFKRTATFNDVIHASKITREYEGIFPPALFIDATLVRDSFSGLSGVDVVRTRVQNFMKYSVGKWPKFVILDEADRLGFEAQGALSSLIERYPNTRTIYTTNFLDDIMDRIVSRAAGGVLEFEKPQPRSIASFLHRVVKIQEVKVPPKKLMEIATRAPSVRDAVGMLQQECAVK
ncbi:MAG: hypothetical protein OEY30_01900, partial [Candidatus Bathyarchaeota archaeon]|nr:hypothetical protein [Candidatus Bathyarchaeota archaeon]